MITSVLTQPTIIVYLHSALQTDGRTENNISVEIPRASCGLRIAVKGTELIADICILDMANTEYRQQI